MGKSIVLGFVYLGQITNLLMEKEDEAAGRVPQRRRRPQAAPPLPTTAHAAAARAGAALPPWGPVPRRRQALWLHVLRR